MTLIDPEDYKNAPEGHQTYAAIMLKTPKRILHFSDGILEEYSDDEVDCTPSENKAIVDIATLSWGPWTWYKLWSVGSTTFNCLDAAGEFLAAFLGITTPKYYFELEQYKNKTNASEVENAQNKGWSEPSFDSEGHISFKNVQTTQPSIPDIV